MVYASLNESAGFEVVQATQKDFTRAVEVFETYEPLPFGDATIVAYIQRETIDHPYSFDDDFDAVDGLIRLQAADNPLG